MMLYGEPGTDGSGIRRVLNARDWSVFEQTADRFREAADVLGSSSDVFGLIHGDFHHGNFLSQGNDIAALDFDDCGFGTYAYDIAVTLSGIIRRPNFRELRSALLEGYRSIRPFPETHERHFGCMVAMRWIMLAVWKAGVYDPPRLHGDAEVFAKQRVKDIRERSLHKQDMTV